MTSASSTTRPLCVLIATGGTIAMRLDPINHTPVPALSGDDLLAAVPAISNIAQLEVNNLSNIPSGYMGPKEWQALQQAVTAAMARQQVCGVIVSHGTDTLEETAWFLDLTVNISKPLVLIGAQRHASSPDFDGPRNLLNAAKICATPNASQLGAVIAMNNQINAAREVSKTHTTDVETFKSGDFGLLGSIDEDRVLLARQPLRRQHIELLQQPLPRVEIIPMFGGASGDLLRAAVDLGAAGIVIQALGLGNVNAQLYQAIEQAIAAGVAIVIASRVPNGRVQPSYGFVGGGHTLQALGAVFADNLSPQKARILLMLALQSCKEPQQLQRFFDR